MTRGRRGSLLLRRRALPSPPPSRFIPAHVAVGTGLAAGPPRRSRRAELPHRAPALGLGVKSHVRVRVHDANFREPSDLEPAHPRPGDRGALAPPLERRAPVPGHLFTEGPDG